MVGKRRDTPAFNESKESSRTNHMHRAMESEKMSQIRGTAIGPNVRGKPVLRANSTRKENE